MQLWMFFCVTQKCSSELRNHSLPLRYVASQHFFLKIFNFFLHFSPHPSLCFHIMPKIGQIWPQKRQKPPKIIFKILSFFVKNLIICLKKTLSKKKIYAQRTYILYYLVGSTLPFDDFDFLFCLTFNASLQTVTLPKYSESIFVFLTALL